MRIGVNGGSLNQELVIARMQENTDKNLGLTSEEIINECMVLSAIESTALAIDCGLRKDQIIISCKTSRPRDLIAVYRALARQTDQPLHLGLTEAGMGMKGLVWSSAAMGALLEEGIGDTIRISLTPRPGGDRREEVYAAEHRKPTVTFGKDIATDLSRRDFTVNALALEKVPRITRAQSMDVLSSQATVSGYKAVLIGAGLLPKMLPKTASSMYCCRRRGTSVFPAHRRPRKRTRTPRGKPSASACASSPKSCAALNAICCSKA